MIASAIRELASADNSASIAAALFEKTVQIWDLSLERKVSEFSTVFCTGAGNLALAPFGQMLVAGGSTGGAVAAYELPGGRKLWERQLVCPSSLRFDPSGRTVLCTTDSRSVLRLDADTGNTLEVIAGVRRYVEGAFGKTLSILSRGGNNLLHLSEKGHGFDIPMLGFALLDAQFSPDFVCVSEARGPVRCIRVVDAKLQWMFDPGVENHVVRLHYVPRMDVFYGILRGLSEEGSTHLVRFDALGVCQRISDLDSWDEAFLEAAEQLVTSRGDILSLIDGAMVGRLAFPMREYPDDLMRIRGL